MSIAKNSFVIFTAKVILSFFTFATAIVIARVLGPKGLGIYSLFLAIIGLTVNLGSLGIGSASLYLLNREKRNVHALFSNAVIFGLAWGVVLAVALLTLSFLFPYAIFSLPPPYFMIGLLIVPLHLLHMYLLPFFMARLEVHWWSFISILYPAFVFFGTLAALFVFGLGVFGSILAIAASSILSSALLLLLLWKKHSLSFRPQRGLFKEQIYFGLRSYLGELFNTIHFKLNTFMTSFFVTIISIGQLAVALNMVSILFFIPFSLQQAFNPVWASRDTKEIDQISAQVARQSLFLGIVSALFFSLFVKQLIPLLFGEGFISAVRPFLLLLPGFISSMVASVFFANFFARGKPQFTSFILLATLLLNVVLNMVFLPMQGIEGTASAISFSLVAGALLSILVFSRVAHIPLSRIIAFQEDDFRSLVFQFRSLIDAKKFISVSPDLTLEKLKEYYEQKGKEDGPRILSGTFESPAFYKRIFYGSRTKAIMDFLDVKPEERVLEIGCGVGYYTKKIASISPRFVATDIAQSFVDYAKKYNPHPVEGYVVCPVENMPFEDNSFDKVLMSEVIEHLIDPEQGVKEMYRVLKPGGKAVVVTPNTNSYLNTLYHIRLLFGGTHFDKDHIQEFSKRSLTKLLQKYFIITHAQYVNYIPWIIPRFIGSMIGLKRMQDMVDCMEALCNRIPGIRVMGFSMVFQVEKKHEY